MVELTPVGERGAEDCEGSGFESGSVAGSVAATGAAWARDGASGAWVVVMVGTSSFTEGFY